MNWIYSRFIILHYAAQGKWKSACWQDMFKKNIGPCSLLFPRPPNIFCSVPQNSFAKSAQQLRPQSYRGDRRTEGGSDLFVLLPEYPCRYTEVLIQRDTSCLDSEASLSPWYVTAWYVKGSHLGTQRALSINVRAHYVHTFRMLSSLHPATNSEIFESTMYIIIGCNLDLHRLSCASRKLTSLLTLSLKLKILNFNVYPFLKGSSTTITFLFEPQNNNSLPEDSYFPHNKHLTQVFDLLQCFP